MTRRYARAPRGQQAYGAVPRNRGPNFSLIGALGVRGMVAAMTGEGAVDTDTFDIFVKRALVPALQPEDIVLLDNLSVYQASGIELAVKAGGTSELSAAVFPGFLTAGAMLVEDQNLLAQLWGKHAPAIRHRRAPSSPAHSAARYSWLVPALWLSGLIQVKTAVNEQTEGKRLSFLLNLEGIIARSFPPVSPFWMVLSVNSTRAS